MKCKFYNLCFFFVLFSGMLLHAQERTISGVVTDESGPLPGVSIIIKGTTTGTETDFDGKYTIKANTGDVLVYSFIGMTKQEKTVGTSNVIDVVMEADNVLDEVVVVAYGTANKETITS
ncbi:MAG TPA: SusC/RagA family TonB-linked outer membrane protein, partial [Flavobacteriia bacterium]|nr:SusC/RagA family TonB-linked outer membrane protein [Flavobacteriia bacterium]